MPLYEYECPECKKRVERLERFDASVSHCEKCKVEMKRLISRTSFALKGGGWAADGYGSGKS